MYILHSKAYIAYTLGKKVYIVYIELPKSCDQGNPRCSKIENILARPYEDDLVAKNLTIDFGWRGDILCVWN